MTDTTDIRSLSDGKVILMLSPEICKYPGFRISAIVILFNRAMDCAAKGQVESAKTKLSAIGWSRINDPNPLVREWAEHCRKMLYSNTPAERRVLTLTRPRDPNEAENTHTDAELLAMIVESEAQS